MTDIVLFGIPGAGKGTQAKLIADYSSNQYIHLSTGDVFRSLMSHSNAIGDHVRDKMESGQLVHDKVTMSLFDMYFFSVLEDDKSMLLDGYPRSIPQLNAYLTKTHEYDRNLLGIFFDLSEQVAIERMMSRARAGETRAVIATRLEKYYKYTHPIMQAFAAQQQLITIDASGTIEQVHHLVKDVLSSYNH